MLPLGPVSSYQGEVREEEGHRQLQWAGPATQQSTKGVSSSRGSGQCMSRKRRWISTAFRLMYALANKTEVWEFKNHLILSCAIHLQHCVTRALYDIPWEQQTTSSTNSYLTLLPAWSTPGPWCYRVGCFMIHGPKQFIKLLHCPLVQWVGKRQLSKIMLRWDLSIPLIWVACLTSVFFGLWGTLNLETKSSCFPKSSSSNFTWNAISTHCCWSRRDQCWFRGGHLKCSALR